MSEWIKVSDQLPDEDTLCLGVEDNGVIWTMHFDGGGFNADTGGVDDLIVTHWMALPEPPTS